MLVPYKVLLPKRIFKKAKSEQEVQALTKEYMQRYPHYSLIDIENGFAICERNNSLQEGNHGKV
ncbi:hypothetical protein [Paucisalibacillus globulus]|uniref:hypothetical protein n=1 Tax=Paucisalibacillus globulus TaxID=351095 RepID=UPI0003F7BB26|nr:hypothetical protein [Paucisalibacillus globulus]